MRPGLDISLSDRTAVVTGACSPIGIATALTLARRGVAVHVLDEDHDGVHAVANAVDRAGGRAGAYALALTDAPAVRAAATAIAGTAGPADLLVLTAAEALHTPAGPLPERWRRTLADGTRGVRNAIDAFGGQLAATGGRGAAADLVAVASSSPDTPGSTLWDDLRTEFNGRGVRLTMIERGMYEIGRHPLMSDISAMSPIVAEESGENAGRLSAFDIADLVCFVAGRPEHVALPWVSIMSARDP